MRWCILRICGPRKRDPERNHAIGPEARIDAGQLVRSCAAGVRRRRAAQSRARPPRRADRCAAIARVRRDGRAAAVLEHVAQRRRAMPATRAPGRRAGPSPPTRRARRRALAHRSRCRPRAECFPRPASESAASRGTRAARRGRRRSSASSRLSASICSDEPPPACAERGADRDLLPTHRRAHEQQIGDVRARDQDDDADRRRAASTGRVACCRRPGRGA